MGVFRVQTTERRAHQKVGKGEFIYWMVDVPEYETVDELTEALRADSVIGDRLWFHAAEEEGEPILIVHRRERAALFPAMLRSITVPDRRLVEYSL